MSEQTRKDFFELLREHPSIDRHSRWFDVKKKIESDHRYKAIESSILREDLFHEYCKILKEEKKKAKDKNRDKERKEKKSDKKDKHKDKKRESKDSVGSPKNTSETIEQVNFFIKYIVLQFKYNTLFLGFGLVTKPRRWGTSTNVGR